MHATCWNFTSYVSNLHGTDTDVWFCDNEAIKVRKELNQGKKHISTEPGLVVLDANENIVFRS